MEMIEFKMVPCQKWDNLCVRCADTLSILGKSIMVKSWCLCETFHTSPIMLPAFVQSHDCTLVTAKL